MELTVAITGASGSIYAHRTLLHMAASGAIASGAGTNLIHRAADVTLKEGRRLVLVVRETPYNAVHLKNMLRLAHAGARVLPASPGFYHRPQTIEQLVDHLVFRILDQFGRRGDQPTAQSSAVGGRSPDSREIGRAHV